MELLDLPNVDIVLFGSFLKSKFDALDVFSEFFILAYFTARQKGKYLTQSYEKKTHTPTENKKKNSMTTQKCHQQFDYTTIVSGIRSVSRNNDIHPTCVVNRYTGYQPSH